VVCSDELCGVGMQQALLGETGTCSSCWQHSLTSTGVEPHLAVHVCSKLDSAPAILGAFQGVHSTQVLVDEQFDPGRVAQISHTIGGISAA
jgi:hypothetical protein